MAYVPIQEKQLEDLTTNGGGTVTTTQGGTATGGNGNASNLTQLTAAPGTAPSQFVNFQDLVDANNQATTDYSKNVGNLIGLGDTTNTLNKDTTNAQNSVNSGYTDVGDDVVNRVLSNPNDTAFDGYSTLKSILSGGGYTGPADASTLYAGSQQALSDLTDKSSTLNDPSSLTSLLLQHPNQGTTTGGASLDAALLNATKGSQDQIADVQKQVGDLQSKYNTDLSQTQQSITDKQNQAVARKSAILGQAEGALGGIRSQADSTLQQQQAQEQQKIDQITNAAKSGDFGTLSALIPGLNGSQLADVMRQVRGAPTDYSNYLSVQGPDLTQGNFVSDADRARYEGIKNTFGLSDAGLAAAGRGGAVTNFDAGGAMSALNSRLTSQRNADAAAAAQAAAEQAARDAAAQQAAAQAAQTAAGSKFVWPVGTVLPATTYYPAGGATAGGTGGAGSTAVGSTTTPGMASAIGNVASAVTGIPGLSQVAQSLASQSNSVANANAAANAAALDATMDAAAAPDATSASVGAAAAAAAAANGDSGAAAGVASADGSPGGGGSEGSGDGGGGGGGGGKIICTAMNDLYGLPYRENKVWIKYATTHLKPEHQKGYHKVFLPLVDYGFKKGDGWSNKLVRNALIYIGKHRTIDIEAELNGTYRRPVHKFLRSVIEPTLALIGKWSKK